MLFFACQSKNSLQINDLKFNRREKSAIALNEIDTVFSISNRTENNILKSDTNLFIYDREGNLISEIYGKRNFGFSYDYEYDSLGWIKKKTVHSDFKAEYRCSYYFDAEKLMLYQYWTGNETDTCTFKFNEKGYNIESFEYSNNSSGKGWPQRTKYEFNSNNTLLRENKTTEIDDATRKAVEKNMNVELPVNFITKYYYTDTRLDSSITTLYNSKSTQIDVFKSFYFPDGLKKYTTRNDSLLVRFAYSKR